MEPSSFLKNQRIPSDKSLSLRVLFNLLFVLSIGFNVYFLIFHDGPNSEGHEHAAVLKEEKVFKKDLVSLSKNPINSEELTTVHDEDLTQSSNSTERLPYEVKKTSFGSLTQPTDTNIKILRVKIRNSLNFSVCQEIKVKSECRSLSAHLARILAWFLDVNSDIRNGDDLNVVYERLNSEGQPKILKLTFQSSYLERTLEANFYSGAGVKYGGYFDRNGKEIAQRIEKKYSPIAEYKEITSLPGDFRKGRRGHSGTDFKADIGTPIRVTFDGRVTRTSWNVKGNGYCIEVDHPRQGVKTRYLHLSRVLVKRGQYVKQGDTIGKSGNTGRSFAPHLHYEIRSRDKKKTVLNPFHFKYLKTYHRNISNQESEKFQEAIHVYDTLLKKNGVSGKIQTD